MRTKTRVTQSFNQYFEKETKIWRQNILNQFYCVPSSCLRSHFVIYLLFDLTTLFFGNADFRRVLFDPQAAMGPTHGTSFLSLN